jgi:hypothetical protein
MMDTQLDWVRRMNYLGSAVGGARRLVGLDADEMIEQAIASTGLRDFGEPEWEEPYRVLVASLEKDVDLHTLGRLLTRTEILRSLRNRLLVTDAHARQPEIGRERIDSPVVIAGQGRTGTSILFELLALDPNNRAPLGWEAASPVEPAPHMVTDGIGRAEIAQTNNELWDDIEPGIKAAHEHRWDLPVECIRFMDSDFTSDWWVMLYAAWDWIRWRIEHPSDSAYRWHKKVMQLLQHGGDGRRWLLKSPAHLGALDKLLVQYPDLRIVHTHRDPVKSVPSTVSLSGMMRASRANGVDTKVLAQMVCIGYAGSLRKGIDERESGAIPAAQIVDVHFQDLMKDPVGTVEKMYGGLGLAFEGRFADAIRDYLHAKPRHSFGKHEYRAEDYGLTNEGIRDTFRFYTDHYGIALEA